MSDKKTETSQIEKNIKINAENKKDRVFTKLRNIPMIYREFVTNKLEVMNRLSSAFGGSRYLAMVTYLWYKFFYEKKKTDS